MIVFLARNFRRILFNLTNRRFQTDTCCTDCNICWPAREGDRALSELRALWHPREWDNTRMLLVAQIALGIVLSFLLLRYLPLIIRAGALVLLALAVVFLWLCFWPVIGPVRWQVVRFKEGRRLLRSKFESNAYVGKRLARQPHITGRAAQESWSE